MQNKKNVVVLISILLFITVSSLVGNFIYSRYYKIDFTPYTYVFQSNIADSPDKEHSVSVTIYKMDEDSEIAYIMATLGSLDNNGGYSKNAKTIFWQEVNSDSIKQKTINGETLANWIDVTWLNSQTIKINSITFDIKDAYDYRRN